MSSAEKKELPKVELRYFNLRGRAEQIRLVLAYAKQEYTEIAIEQSDWGGHKGKQPLGQLPVLIETDTEGHSWEIPQSISILRHLARVHNLYGKTEKEHTLADIVSDTVLEHRLDLNVKFAFRPLFNTKKEPREKWFQEELPILLKKLDGFISNSADPKSGYLVASAPTYPDFQAFDLLDVIQQLHPKALANHPKLVKFFEQVGDLAGVKEYIAKRRGSDFAVFKKRYPDSEE